MLNERLSTTSPWHYAMMPQMMSLMSSMSLPVYFSGVIVMCFILRSPLLLHLWGRTRQRGRILSE